jgi:hypothetical protein
MNIWIYTSAMNGEEFQIVVRKPLSDLEAELRSRYKIEGHPLDSSFIEDGAVVFVFGDHARKPGPGGDTLHARRERRRRKGRRNRTRTRGWKPLATVTNSLGQRVRIYDVFANALKDKQLGRGEQRKIVESLIRANGNDPTRDQVDYFLGNTLEYLRQGSPKQVAQ